MSMTIESTSSHDNTTRTSIPEPTDDHNKILVIILVIALPTLTCVALLTLSFICYRRRQTKLWLKKLGNSSRLQSFGTNLPSISIHSQYPEKKRRLSHRLYLQPRTETIVYNQLSPSSTPVINSSAKGETNAAFEEYVIKNEQQPILKEHPTTPKANHPVLVQTPVQKITSAFVEAIATHRLSLYTDANNPSLETSPNTVHNSQHSIASTSCLNTPPLPPPTLLLFSQRTQF